MCGFSASLFLAGWFVPPPLVRAPPVEFPAPPQVNQVLASLVPRSITGVHFGCVAMVFYGVLGKVLYGLSWLRDAGDCGGCVRVKVVGGT